MTVDEIISKVAVFFDRHDLVEILRKQFPQALRTAHSYQKFNRDLGNIYLPEPVVVNNTVFITAATLPQFQTFLGLYGYTDYATSVIGADTFYYPGTSDGVVYRNLNEGYAASDYFGFRYESGFLQMGQTITLKGVPDTCKLLEVKAVLWPTFTYNSLSDTYSTNSWIAEEYPALLEQLLKVYAATVAQQTDVLQNARNELAQVREDFLNSFTGDIYGGQSIGSN